MDIMTVQNFDVMFDS